MMATPSPRGPEVQEEREKKPMTSRSSLLPSPRPPENMDKDQIAVVIYAEDGKVLTQRLVAQNLSLKTLFDRIEKAQKEGGNSQKPAVPEDALERATINGIPIKDTGMTVKQLHEVHCDSDQRTSLQVILKDSKGVQKLTEEFERKAADASQGKEKAAAPTDRPRVMRKSNSWFPEVNSARRLGKSASLDRVYLPDKGIELPINDVEKTVQLSGCVAVQCEAPQREKKKQWRYLFDGGMTGKELKEKLYEKSCEDGWLRKGDSKLGLEVCIGGQPLRRSANMSLKELNRFHKSGDSLQVSLSFCQRCAETCEQVCKMDPATFAQSEDPLSDIMALIEDAKKYKEEKDSLVAERDAARAEAEKLKQELLQKHDACLAEERHRAEQEAKLSKERLKQELVEKGQDLQKMQTKLMMAEQECASLRIKLMKLQKDVHVQGLKAQPDWNLEAAKAACVIDQAGQGLSTKASGLTKSSRRVGKKPVPNCSEIAQGLLKSSSSATLGTVKKVVLGQLGYQTKAGEKSKDGSKV